MRCTRSRRGRGDEDVETELVTIPYLIGRPLDEAESVLAAEGLEVDVRPWSVETDLPPGTVAGQVPPMVSRSRVLA